jgi:hypothetical protein
MQLKEFKENNSGVNLIDVYIEIMLYTCSFHLCMSSPLFLGKELQSFLKIVFLITLPVFITACQYNFHDKPVTVM